MRTIEKCKSVLNNAASDGIIGDWDFVDITAGGDIYKQYLVVICDPEGQLQWDGVDAFQKAAYYIENLPKKTTVTLKEAVDKLFRELPTEIQHYILLWADTDCENRLLNMVRDTVIHNTPRFRCLSVHSMMGHPTFEMKTTATMVVRVSGTLDKIELNVQKNRYGHTFNLHCTTKEKTVNTKVCNCNHVGCSICYEELTYKECFSVLRKAKKDGVIAEWRYSNDQYPIVAVLIGRANGMTFPDTDGTKGDIGILREAVAYVKKLRAERPKPVGKMVPEELLREIRTSGYTFKLDSWTYGLEESPAVSLAKNDKVVGVTTSPDKEYTMHDFLRECVTHIRGQKRDN